MTSRHLLPVFLLLAAASFARGQGQWTLTTAEFRTQAVFVKSIDAAGLHVTTPAAGAEEKTIPFEQFLDIARPVVTTQAGGKYVLHLAGEDHVGGEPVGIKGNDLIWNSPTLGEISLPMKQLVAMTRPGVVPPDVRRREDVVTLANGDSLRGIVSGFGDGKITVQTDAGNSSVPITSVNLINFAITPESKSGATAFRVRLDDGSSIVAASVRVTGEKAELSFGKDVNRTVDLARVAAIEQVNGPVSWLSSRATLESVYIPFIGSPRTNAAHMNRNWSGQDPIRFGTQEFAHGIGVHSYSRLSWALDGSYAAFRTRYAIDTKDANTRADVTVRVLLDGKVAYEQAHVRAGAISPVILEELKDAKKLTLEVDYGDNLDTEDRLNWIEPALLKNKPTDAPAAK